MISFDRLYNVMCRGEVLSKEASTAPHAFSEKIAFWRDAKAEAETYPEGPLVGLAKIAARTWKQAHQAGEDASKLEEAMPFAASFACAKVVDDAVEDMLTRGEVNSVDAEKLSAMNAAAAFDDLEKVAFGLGSLMEALKAHPHAAGMAIGALVGAGVGALHDEDNPLRGAASGAALGTAVGALGGQVAHDLSSQGFANRAAQHFTNEQTAEEIKKKFKGMGGRPV